MERYVVQLVVKSEIRDMTVALSDKTRNTADLDDDGNVAYASAPPGRVEFVGDPYSCSLCKYSEVAAPVPIASGHTIGQKKKGNPRLETPRPTTPG